MKKNQYTELVNLKKKMKEEKKTYRELSKTVGLSLNALNSKLNGYTSFNLDEASKIIDVLNIKPEEIKDYFFSGEVAKCNNADVN